MLGVLLAQSILLTYFEHIMVSLPDHLASWLDEWGPHLREQVQNALNEEGLFSQLSKRSKRPKRSRTVFSDDCFSTGALDCLRIGTDCSGVESPIHALKAMQVPHRHVFSCECGPAPRRVIQANTPPSVALYEDILTSLEFEIPFVDVYVAGFSCKPFSMLHVGTQLLEEDQAKIFFAVLARIKKQRPSLFVLENVPGIARCMDDVLRLLQDAGYVVAVHLLNPFDLGEPVHRPRFYFLGVREDVALFTQREAQGIYERVWQRLKAHSGSSGPSGPAVSIMKRILPHDHPCVVESQRVQQKRWQHASAFNFHLADCAGLKWPHRHRTWEEQRTSDLTAPSQFLPDADELFLHLPRERDAWTKLASFRHTPKRVVADLSQSLGRQPMQSDATPTITPGSHMVLSEARRMMAPVEKLMLHCLPVHRMNLCGIGASELEDMGGNMMHLQTVGAALLIGLSLVDWGAPTARVLASDGPAVPAVLAVQAGTQKSKSLMTDLKAQKRIEAKIRARFGICPPRTLVKASVTKSKPRVKSRLMPKHKACLRGTRWAS